MKYGAHKIVDNEVLNLKTIKEDVVFRNLALSIVKDLPIDDVKKLFNLKVVRLDTGSSLFTSEFFIK